MPFLCWSHTQMSIAVLNFYKNICYAAKKAIPSSYINLISFFKKRQKTVIKNNQAIGATDNRTKRAVPSVSSARGSLTVEAALVLPVFLGMLLLLGGLMEVMAVNEQVNHYLCITAKRMAAYSETANAVTVFYSGMADSGIETSMITGGYAGIVPSFSEDENDPGLLKLQVVYRVKVPGYFAGSRSVLVTETVFARKWIGGTAGMEEKAGDSKNTVVYVAEHGGVYHTSESCTYLLLSVRQVPFAALDSLRNQYGSKYKSCECCGFRQTSQVYITEKGEAWHTDRMCSGLKRSLHTVTEDSARQQGLHACSRCGG